MNTDIYVLFKFLLNTKNVCKFFAADDTKHLLQTQCCIFFDILCSDQLPVFPLFLVIPYFLFDNYVPSKCLSTVPVAIKLKLYQVD